MMARRDLLNKGVQQITPTLFGHEGVNIYIIGDYATALGLIERKSEQHVDFSAVFLDWNLSSADRAAGYSGVKLALAALDEKNQPLAPTIYCISSEAFEMKHKILEETETLAAAAGGNPIPVLKRIVLVDYMSVAGKILEVAGCDGTPSP